MNIVGVQIAYDMATRSGRYSVNDGTARVWLTADVNGSSSLDASDAFAIQHAVRFGWR